MPGERRVPRFLGWYAMRYKHWDECHAICHVEADIPVSDELEGTAWKYINVE